MNDGLISPGDLASKYIPAWRSDPLKSKITIRQLATHTSGIADAEQDDIPHDRLPGWKGDFWKRAPDPFSIALHQAPVLFEPGTQYAYSNPGMAALSYAVTAALKGGDIFTLLKRRVLDPLGVPDSNWSIGYGRAYDLDGLKLYANWGGATFTARAAARVGQLKDAAGSLAGAGVDPARCRQGRSH
jgi:CubicO group peptidase (beta-lactamase class C family)